MKFFSRKFLSLICLTALVCGANGCAELNELKQPKPTTFYGTATPPQTNEFRWANGETPKTFDPALAASPSETQAVRAAFEGLTEWDAKTLQPLPAIAASWDKSEDARTWTFHLRPNAVWSNNKKITAQDFVNSWRRLLELGEKSKHRALLDNVIGAREVQSPVDAVQSSKSASTAQNPESKVQSPAELPNESPKAETEVQSEIQPVEELPEVQNPKSKIENSVWFGVEAVDELTLLVSLVEPDQDFLKLTAHSALRPIFGDGAQFEKPETAQRIVTSGAFKFLEYSKNSVSLERSKNYWNAHTVKLERIRFLPIKNAEAALNLYRSGEVDAVTNVLFEPLALKLLQSYTDFKRTPFNAVTYYEFNQEQKPFDDKRVRKALAIAINREQLVNDELDGANFAANKFLPDSNNQALKFDAAAARSLLHDAGFANGKNFPKIRVLINRNDAQKSIARAIAQQWRKNLGIETEIVSSSLEELSDREKTKDFAVVRRVTILPTTAATANLRLLFGVKKPASPIQTVAVQQSLESSPSNPTAPITNDETAAAPPPDLSKDAAKNVSADALPAAENLTDAVEQPKPADAAQTDLNIDLPADLFESENQSLFATESAALAEMPAIPLYFSASYALVKPYINGFETNLLDAPALGKVEIQTDWQAEAE